MKYHILLVSMILLFGCKKNEMNQLDNYNITWDSPSKDHHGSMPLGNGDIGLNLWVEENGDICFYIGKTDSWGDNGRLLKVGKVRIKSEPVIFSPHTEFRLHLSCRAPESFSFAHLL